MDTSQIVEKIHNLLSSNLVMSSPVLSGNMKQHIKASIGTDDRTVIIDAPFYDMKKWEKEHAIVHTGQIINGRTAYAEWVNRLGAFGHRNKSWHWVNRAIIEVVSAIANEIGAEVIYEL